MHMSFTFVVFKQKYKLTIHIIWWHAYQFLTESKTDVSPTATLEPIYYIQDVIWKKKNLLGCTVQKTQKFK